MEDDIPSLDALMAAAATTPERAQASAVTEVPPSYDALGNACWAMMHALANWYQRTLLPAFTRIAQVLVQALGNIGRQFRRRTLHNPSGRTTRQLRLAARRCSQQRM